MTDITNSTVTEKSIAVRAMRDQLQRISQILSMPHLDTDSTAEIRACCRVITGATEAYDRYLE